MHFFLRLKHWQLFLACLGIPLALQLLIISTALQAADPFEVLGWVLVQTLVFVFVFFSWFYAMGVYLHQKLPATVPMNVTRFRWFLFIPLVYILLFLMYFVYLMSMMPTRQGTAPSHLALLIIPLHLFSMFCMFYNLNFVSKALKAAELQRPVAFSDYAGEFFLIWFFPIGIWLIQPRINRIFAAPPLPENASS